MSLIFAISMLASQDLLTWKPSDPTPTSTPSPKPWEDAARNYKEALARPIPPNSLDIIGRELARFHGKPVQYAFGRLGYPDKKMSIEGATVYSWANQTPNLDGSTLTCTVKIVLRGGRIISTDFHGNVGACNLYAEKLNPSFIGH